MSTNLQDIYDKFEDAIKAYNTYCSIMGSDDPVSGDHFTGTAFIFFKGTEEDTDRIREVMNMRKAERVFPILGSE